MKKLLKRTTADDFRVMPYNLRWFTVLGIGSSPNDRRLYRLAVALGLTVVAIILPKPIRISDQHPRFESIVRSVAELLFGVLGFLTIIIVASKSEPFRQVIQKLEQALTSFRDRDDQCSRLIVKVNGGIYRFSVAFARLNLCYMLLFNLVPPAVNYPYYLHHLLSATSSNKTRTVEFMLPLEQDFYGLDIRHNILHYSVFWLVTWPACTFTTVILWCKGPLFILIRYNTLLYQLVNCMLRELGAATVNGVSKSRRRLLTWKQRQLVQIVELHRTAIECTKLLDSILRLVLLIQSVGCLLMWCLMLYYISRNANLNVLNVVVLTLSIVFEMWCWSYLGHQLTEENASIANTVYSSCCWYDEPRVLQKSYQRIMMQASSRKATITAGRFYNVNIVTFAQLVKTSYTYYMIMKEIF